MAWFFSAVTSRVYTCEYPDSSDVNQMRLLSTQPIGEISPNPLVVGPPTQASSCCRSKSESFCVAGSSSMIQQSLKSKERIINTQYDPSSDQLMSEKFT